MRKKSFIEGFAAVPHIVWLFLFVVLPLVFVVYFAFTGADGSFSFSNIANLSRYGHIFVLSICFALIATVLCLLIGYPLAYFMSRLKPKTQKMLVVLLMLPMWISLLIRTYSLMAILDNGVVVEEGAVGAVFASPKSDAAKRLVFPAGEDESVSDPSTEKRLRVIFSGSGAASTPLISTMAIEKGILVNIVSASTRSYAGKTYGSMLLGVPGGDDNYNAAKEYLSGVDNIAVEEV